jgi:glycosyltransferase involved in cell wall biosynthesis
MKIAFVHDYLNQYGGAERVLQVLCSMFPDAPIHTTVYDPERTGHVFDDRVIRTSFLQRIPGASRYHHLFPWLMPLAVEQFDFSEYDVVFSISSSFAKGIITKPGTRHICYCLTPIRYLWDDSHKYLNESEYPALVKKLIPFFLSYLRVWDKEASIRPDEMIAISRFVAGRVKKYYSRASEIIYPPVNMEKFQISDTVEDYFLMVGRLVPYKKFDMVIRVFNKLNWPLKIAGTGPQLDALKRLAKPNVEFMGAVDDQELAGLYSHAKALIFPQEEDFGIVPLEAMASGRPVIAYAGGGALETIVDGMSGMFFSQQTEASLTDALRRFQSVRFDPKACRMQAEKFSVRRFQEGIHVLLNAGI